MRILAISDTHGQLEYINEIVRKHKIDTVIHCGDFGFNTHSKVNNYPNRELSLQIKHSPSVPIDIRKQAWTLSREEKIQYILEYQALGSFDEYLQGNKEFEVPVYTIWGNHEDMQIIREQLKNPTIPNLNLLKSTSDITIDKKIQLLGVGGNLSLRHFFRKPYIDEFYPFMTFQEWIYIKAMIKKFKKRKNKIWLLTHVSPGKNPLFELFSLYLKPNIWFSGHMGAPFPQHYSMFTTMDDQDFIPRIEAHLKIIKPLWEETKLKWKSSVNLQDFINDNLTLSFPDILTKYRAFHSEVITEEIEKENFNYFTELINQNQQGSIYPQPSEYKMLMGNAYILDIPFQLKSDKSLKEYNTRTPAQRMRGTWFFNLPDVYSGGYVIIDTDGNDFYENNVEAYGHL